MQSATSQARHAAAAIVHGSSAVLDELPTFWSVQGDLRLQIAGVATDADPSDVVERGPGRCNAFRFREGRLVCVESLNDPATHLAARRALQGRGLTRHTLNAAGFDLRSAFAAA